MIELTAKSQKRMKAVEIRGVSFWYTDIFIGRVPMLKTVVALNLVTLAYVLFR